ncbi:protein Wnt [Caerostris darwini]|uniref:Protein Wnt n=1 Tax=Caerostris darwini TaxID=1538125 RepID=A0AAV4RCL3_9ARAC|nr:protein Wnt [Caerostris darwini]
MVGVSVTPPDMASEQVSLCSAVPGLVVQQQRVCNAHPAVIRAVSGGARRGIEECQNQFRHDRWNCTVEGGESVFDHTLQRGKLLVIPEFITRKAFEYVKHWAHKFHGNIINQHPEHK